MFGDSCLAMYSSVPSMGEMTVRLLAGLQDRLLLGEVFCLCPSPDMCPKQLV